MLAMCSTIRAFAPEPTAIMAMTALTPMMIPSIVKADLILFTIRALNAIRKLARIVVMFYVFFVPHIFRIRPLQPILRIFGRPLLPCESFLLNHPRYQGVSSENPPAYSRIMDIQGIFHLTLDSHSYLQ